MPHTGLSTPRRLLVAALSLALVIGFVPASPTRAAPTPIFINEIHYDNAGGDTGEAVEVAGPAGTNLAGYSLVAYNGSNSAAYSSMNLIGTLEDQEGGLGTAAFSISGLQNGAPDGIALVGPGDALIQFLSYEGTFTGAGGAADGVLSTDIGVSESGSGPVGESLQLTGVGTTYEDFTWAGSAASSFGAPNTGVGQVFGDGPPPVIADCGSALSVMEGVGAMRTVTASDADGTVTDIQILSITNDPGTITVGATTPANGVGGTASADITIGAATAAGSYDVLVEASNDDAEPQTGQCTLSVTIQPILTIGEVQGPTTNTEDGLTDASPYAGQSVYVEGVVTERMRFATSSGSHSYGIFLQSRVGATDGDPQSSDGIFVYLGFYGDIGPYPYYDPVVGDELVLHASVSEYFNLTELSSLSLVSVEATGIDVTDPTQIETTEATPPDDLATANRYWERHEGMLFHLDAGAAVVAARDVFASTNDGEVWVIRGDHPIAQRADPYQRIVYRDAHPLDAANPGFEPDGNGMRILLTSHGLKGNEDSNDPLIAPARTYDTVTNALTGGLYFAFGKYGIEIEQQLALTPGVDPALNAPPAAAVDGVEFSTSDYNVQNLYDYRDDPFDGCDFLGNAGCPGVYPPFDYVPESQAAYDQHINDLAAQIAGPMHAPDLLMIQEAEDQDICSIVSGAMVCGTTDNADGRPDTLQDLALAISAMGGPTYDTAYDRDGADDRGIVAAFMYRTDTVELLPADASDPVLGSAPTVDYRGTPLSYNTDVQNPKALNAVLPDDVDRSTGTDGSDVYTRAPQVGHFRIWRDGIGTSVFTDLYAISNHFSSTPNARVGQRTEQAAYQAAIVAALEAAGVDRIVSAGDFNVYPRPDDPFTPPDTSDQLGPMYDAGLNNLYDTLLADVPQSAYSYSFQGQAQTLDMQWATDGQFADLVQVRAGHFNADFAANYDGDVARGASDHDPQLARWFNDVTLDRLHALVDYYVGTGDVQASKARLLHDRLDRAERYLERGQVSAYLAQLATFGNQAQGLSPSHASSTAADALQGEANRLATL